MSEDFDFTSMVDDIAKRIQDEVDQAALDKAAVTLAKFGYVKVVRCRDCKRFMPQGTHHWKDGTTNKDSCSVVRGFVVQITPDGFCAWGELRCDAE